MPSSRTRGSKTIEVPASNTSCGNNDHSSTNRCVVECMIVCPVIGTASWPRKFACSLFAGMIRRMGVCFGGCRALSGSDTLVETRGCRGDNDYSPKRESRISEMSPVYQQKAWHDTYERIRTDSICRLAEPESSGDRGCGQLAEPLSDRKTSR